MKKALSVIFLFLLVHAVMAQNFSFYFEGLLRTYRVFIPAVYNPDSIYPMVFNLHGLGSNAIEQEFYTGFDFVADTAGIIMVYPDGVDNTWNVYSLTGVNDVGFISALIDTMESHYNIDPHRVYSTGMSMGGFMSYRLACELESRITAIASVAGLLVFSPCEPTRSVPVLQMHGTADPVVPYAGVSSTIQFWVGKDNCPSTPVITNLPDIDTTDGSTVTVSYYGLCDDSTEVILYTIIGGEHTWPGADYIIGITNQDINGSVEIWNFFKKYSLGESVIVNENFPLVPAINVYPNPLWNYAVIEITDCNTMGYNLKIFDLNGRVVRNFESNKTNRILFSRENLPSGIYMINLELKDGRIIKEKLIIR
jgi:polyhydroxybutyrate depolymerase